MKKNIFFLFGIFIFLSAFCITGSPEAEYAPEVIPPATAEMQHPEFWINILKEPDKVVLTSAQIQELNKKNKTKTFVVKGINGNPSSIEKTVISKDRMGVQFRFENPLDIKSFPGDSLKIRMEMFRNYLEKGKYFDRRQYPYSDTMKKKFIDMADIGNIPDKITPKYGMLIKHTLCRVVPTNDFGVGGPTGWLDMFQAAALDYGTPVAILHETKDKDWLYVRGEFSFGWIPAENVAFGAAPEIMKIYDAKDFIVSISHKVPVYSDKNFSTFIIDCYMGARLPLIAKNSGGYQVIVPVKSPEGTLTTIHGWVKPDAQVNVGFQKFTQRNILNTMFSLLYRPYGWADSDNERDCTGTTRAVYKTFGIFLPRWTNYQTRYSNYVHAFPEDTSIDVKHSIIDKCEPGITLIAHPGHVFMYLGKVGGDYFVIHQSGYSYYDDKKTEFMIRRVNVNDTKLEAGSQVTTWTEIGEFRP